MTDDEILGAGEGFYSHIKRFADGEAACVARMAFTCAVLYKFDYAGHSRRWCYETKADAVRALAEWDGAPGTEPEGWHRDPYTGRRRHEGKEWIQP